MIFVLGFIAYFAGLVIWRHNRVNIGGVDFETIDYRPWQSRVGAPLMIVGLCAMAFSIGRLLWGWLP